MKKPILLLFCLCASLIIAAPPPSPISRIVVDGVEYPVYAYFKDVKALSAVSVPYPYRARKEGRGGDTLVGAVVSEKGEVIATFVAKSTGAEDIQQAARDAVKKWKFPKLTTDDKPTRYVLFVPIIMNLE